MDGLQTADKDTLFLAIKKRVIFNNKDFFYDWGMFIVGKNSLAIVVIMWKIRFSSWKVALFNCVIVLVSVEINRRLGFEIIPVIPRPKRVMVAWSKEA